MASEIETLGEKKLEDVPDVELKDKEDSEKESEEEEEARDDESDGDDDEKIEESKVSSKKGGRGSLKKSKADLSPVTPIERPTRERKTVERYTESMSRLSTPKPFSIEKGSGTQLKDIPNVAYKLSKRKADDNLHSLHTVLFNKRGKTITLKKNIGMFSGFVWADDEQEKQRAKLKEKLDKFTKEKLFDFCDILNLQIYKSSLKKEEVSLKLVEFLQSPHVTTETLLAEKEQKDKKRKARARKSKTPSKKQSGEKRKRASKTQEENNKDENEGSESEADSHEEEEDKNTPSKPESDDEEVKSEEGGEDDDEEQEEKEDTPEKSSSKKKIKKDPETKTEEKPKSVKKDDVKSPTKSNKKSPASGSKKSKEEKSSKKVETKKEPAKKQVKGKTNKKAKTEPTNEEMHAVVSTILKEVDFNTATLSDIIKQLGTHFGQDLLHRKAEVKAIITDVINSMSGEEDDDDEEEEKEETEAAEGGSDEDEDDDKNDS